MAMKCYIVTMQVFACGGDDIEITAHDESEARDKAEAIVKERWAEGYYTAPGANLLDLNEVCVSTICEDKDDRQDHPEPIDPALYENWISLCDAKHPLPTGTLFLSVDGEEDEGE